MAFKLTLSNLNDYLARTQRPTQLLKDTGQLALSFKHPRGEELAIFLRPLDEGNQLQLVIYLPLTVQESALGETARLLHKLNHDMEVPGYGLNEDIKVVFYRLVIFCKNGQCDEQFLDKNMQDGLNHCIKALTVIRAVASGEKRFEETLVPYTDPS